MFSLLFISRVARGMLKDLADEYVEDPASQFPVGRLVAGRVIKTVRSEND